MASFRLCKQDGKTAEKAKGSSPLVFEVLEKGAKYPLGP